MNFRTEERVFNVASRDEDEKRTLSFLENKGKGNFPLYDKIKLTSFSRQINVREVYRTPVL